MDAQPERKPGSLAEQPASPLSGDPVPATRRPAAGTNSSGSSGGSAAEDSSSCGSARGVIGSNNSSEPGWETAMQLVREQHLRLREIAAAQEWLKPVAWALRNLPRFGTCGASAAAAGGSGRNLIDGVFDPFGLLGVGPVPYQLDSSSDHLEARKRESSTGSGGGGSRSSSRSSSGGGGNGSSSSSSSSSSREFNSNRDRADSSGDSSAATAASFAISELRRLMLLGAPDSLRLRAGQGAFREAAGSWLTVDVGALYRSPVSSQHASHSSVASPGSNSGSSSSSGNSSGSSSHGRPASPHAPPSPLAMQRQPSYTSLSSPNNSSSSGCLNNSDLSWQPQRLSTNYASSSRNNHASGGLPEDASSSSAAVSSTVSSTTVEWPSVLARLKVTVPVANVVPDPVQPYAAYRVRVTLGPPQWAKPLAAAAAAGATMVNAETKTRINTSSNDSGSNSMRSSLDRSFHRRRSSSNSGSSSGWESAPFGAPTPNPSASQHGIDHLSKAHHGLSQKQQQQHPSSDVALASFSATPAVR